MTNFEMVQEFHRKFKIDVTQQPLFRLLDFRMRLIAEEYDEALEETDERPVNHEKLCKELCDILYVVYGTGVSLGYDMDKAFAEVHRSNMSKLGKDGEPLYREDGKVLKGPDYSEANLSGIV